MTSSSDNKLFPNTGGKYIRWEKGNPVPVYAPPLNKHQMSELVTAALSSEYEGDVDPETGEPINVDPRYVGMTNAEVMAVRLAKKAASGHDKSVTEVLDRILGKPKQSVESVGVKMNYRDFLDVIQRDEQAQSLAEFEVTTLDINPHTQNEKEDDTDWWDEL